MYYLHSNPKELKFNNKTVLIIGGTSDIGQALARDFSKLGANLILTTRKTGQLDSLKTDLEIRFSIDCDIKFFDVLDFDSHKSFYDNLKRKPDVVITCIGHLNNQFISQHFFNETLYSIQTNFVGLVSILNIISNDFEIRKTGIIVGISSVAGDRGRKSNYIYGSAKSAFSTYLSGLRNRLHKSNVHVITVKPGFIKTKMTDHLNLPKILTATIAETSSYIINGVQGRKNILYIKWYWKFIMLIYKMMPEVIFKKMIL